MIRIVASTVGWCLVFESDAERKELIANLRLMPSDARILFSARDPSQMERMEAMISLGDEAQEELERLYRAFSKGEGKGIVKDGGA
jgi:hypothetical protein